MSMWRELFREKLTIRPTVKAEFPEYMPVVIPLGSSHRPQGSYKELSEVASLSDLPSRLFLGDLERGSFQRTDAGWEARFTDQSPDTGVLLRREGNSLFIKQTWRGVDGAQSYIGRLTWQNLMQTHFVGGIPKAWDQEAEARLKKYKLQYLPFDEDHDSALIGLPDGFSKTIFLPIPLDKLGLAAKLIQHAQADPAIRTPVSAYLTLNDSIVHYFIDCWPSDAYEDSQALFHHTMEQLGPPPLKAPFWQTGLDGTKTLTVHRLQWGLIVACTFRDLERVLDILQKLGLLFGSSERSGPQVGYPSGAEYDAVVMPQGREFELISYYDESHSLEVVYDAVGNPEELAKQMEAAGTDAFFLPPSPELVDESLVKALYGTTELAQRCYR